MEMQEPRRAKTILKNKNKVGRLTPFPFYTMKPQQSQQCDTGIKDRSMKQNRKSRNSSIHI